MRSRVDLNADLGESFGRWVLGDDESLLAVVTSANIACGFHAGDPSTMRRTCEQAMRHNVRIGAQVGYHDLVGFGRRRMDIAPADLAADVLYQLGALRAVASACGGRVSYLKPHGALYNTCVIDAGQAGAVIEALAAYEEPIPVLTLAGSALARAADRRGIGVISEAFADRGYRNDATLAPRGDPGAVLHNPDQIAERVLAMVLSGTVTSVQGVEIPVTADSICLHGDTPGAVEIARAVRAALIHAGVEIGPFSS